VPARHPLFEPLIWNQPALDALGTVPDVKLAALLGINSHTVQAKRRTLGIPTYRPPHVWTAAEDELLGKVSDREICKRLKLSPRTVHDRRRLLNIPAWQKRHQRRCVICGRVFVFKRGRRTVCPPTHQVTRPRALSECHKQLIRATLMVTGKQPASARGLVKRPGGMRFIR
jgi:hypothetical protein